MTTLLDLVKDGKYAELKQQLEKGADVNQKDEHGWTPVHLAALRGDVDALKILLPMKKIDLSLRTLDCGRDALMIAAENGEAEACKLLLDKVTKGSLLNTNSQNKTAYDLLRDRYVRYLNSTGMLSKRALPRYEATLDVMRQPTYAAACNAVDIPLLKRMVRNGEPQTMEKNFWLKFFKDAKIRGEVEQGIEARYAPVLPDLEGIESRKERFDELRKTGKFTTDIAKAYQKFLKCNTDYMEFLGNRFDAPPEFVAEHFTSEQQAKQTFFGVGKPGSGVVSGNGTAAHKATTLVK